MQVKPVIMILLLILLVGCTPKEIKELKAAEVRDYEGEKLGSLGDFRENSIKGVQHVDIDSYRLGITGLVEEPQSFTYEEVISNQRYSKIVRIYCVEGWDVNILWEGVLVRDLISKAGVMPQANTIIFHAYDGYTTSFPLNYVMDNEIIIAYKMNDVTIPPERGFPFQLVAEDKWGYKWIKWITGIELSNNTDYRGTWESAGYNNLGSLEGPKFERG
ncbi:MAG: molybdopterin-dependent oxidoreductase [Nanoarchaeota archaeon]|nr:molybdopterin-dependent oxidoreductase [Nanoarchaeota archaeon]